MGDDIGGAPPPAIGSVKLKTSGSRFKVHRWIHEVESIDVIDLLTDGAGHRYQIPFLVLSASRGRVRDDLGSA